MIAKRAHRARPRRLLLALSLLFGASACAGPPVPSPVKGEPVCPDFEVGATHEKMQGGLVFPVQITIKEGKSVQSKALILGLRNPTDPPTRLILRDGNAEYTVEWAQCENERAPRPVAFSAKNRAEAAAGAYECGTAAPYKNEPLVTRKHALDTHLVTFPTPPKPACWTSEGPGPAPAAATATASASAAAPASAAASAAEAPPASAAPSVSAHAAPSASAPPAPKKAP